jgi:hypothetical protein
VKHQYFGDVNDYRKYGLLRLLSVEGRLRIGICWMLTEKDKRRDGKRTKYLHNSRWKLYERFDPELFHNLRDRVVGHEEDPVVRNVHAFASSLLPNSVRWTHFLLDDKEERRSYFRGMWSSFKSESVRLVFCDPDNGLANNLRAERIRKGHRRSSKFLFRDEVSASLDQGFSFLFYQHFRQRASLEDRTRLKDEVVRSLKLIAATQPIITLTTPDVFYVLLPSYSDRVILYEASGRVAQSMWSTCTGSTTSKTSDGRQILVVHHL